MSSLPSTNPDPASPPPAAEPTSAPGDATGDAAPDVPPVKVDITIAGHTVIVEASRRMEEVGALALHLIGRTAGYARRMSYGFDTRHTDTQLADADDPSTVTATGISKTPGGPR